MIEHGFKSEIEKLAGFSSALLKGVAKMGPAKTMLAGGAVGGVTGAIANDEHPLTGAILGAGMGAAAGLGASALAARAGNVATSATSIGSVAGKAPGKTLSSGPTRPQLPSGPAGPRLLGPAGGPNIRDAKFVDIPSKKMAPFNIGGKIKTFGLN